MDVEAGASAGAGRPAVRQRRIGIGHVDHARQLAADQRFQRLAQPDKSLRQVAHQRRAGVLHRSHHAAVPEQRALGRRVHDHVGHQPGEIDVVGADREQNEVELAVGLAFLRGGKRGAQFAELRVDGALAVGGGFRRQAFAGALRAEQPVRDGGAGAGQRQVGHRDMRILHGERERGAGLIAVQRAVTGGIEPQRAVALPVRQAVRRFAGPSALEPGAARPVILRAGAAQIVAEAEAVVGGARWPGPGCPRRRRCCRQGRR